MVDLRPLRAGVVLVIIVLAAVILIVAASNCYTAYANYRTHCNLVRSLEAQQKFNTAVVEFQRAVEAWINAR